MNENDPLLDQENEFQSHSQFTYGDIGARFVAALIDGLIVGVPMAIVQYVLIGAAPGELALFPMFLNIVVAWLYDAYLTSSPRQATIGKSVMNLFVTDKEGYPLTFAHATGSHFAKIISSLTCMIGYIIALFNDQRQSLHDMIASTYVLSGKAQNY